MKGPLVCLVSFAFALGFGTVASAQSIQVLHGDIVSVDDTSLQLKSASGQQTTVKLPDNLGVSVMSPAKLDDIKPGTFVGTAATPGPNGTLVASEVHIIPDALRGIGEGHHPMSTMPGSTMTNATVAQVSAGSHGRSTMSNAKVEQVGSGGQGRTIKLTYKGGEQTLFVSDRTPVVRYEPGTHASLSPGAHVIVHAKRDTDGNLVAQRISVGANGSVPPI